MNFRDELRFDTDTFDLSFGTIDIELKGKVQIAGTKIHLEKYHRFIMFCGLHRENIYESRLPR